MGEWVETVAADELRERANRIEEIERSVRLSSPIRASGGLPASLSSSGISRIPDEAPTAQHGLRAGARASVVPPSSNQLPIPSQPAVSQVSEVSHLSVSHTDRPKGSRRPTWLIVAAAVALSAIGATAFALRPSRPTAAAPPIPPPTVPIAAPTARVAPPPAPTTTSPSGAGAASVQKPTVFSLDDLPAPAKTHPRPLLPPAAPPQAPGPAQVGIASPPAGAVDRPANRRPSVGPDCNPPYTTDEKGHIHFKPACVN
jgi:hypothetical protein